MNQQKARLGLRVSQSQSCPSPDLCENLGLPHVTGTLSQTFALAADVLYRRTDYVTDTDTQHKKIMSRTAGTATRTRSCPPTELELTSWSTRRRRRRCQAITFTLLGQRKSSAARQQPGQLWLPVVGQRRGSTLVVELEPSRAPWRGLSAPAQDSSTAAAAGRVPVTYMG